MIVKILNYSIAILQIEINKSLIPFVLSCRYLGNYFKIQSNDYKLNIFCEDLVTCIKEKNFCNKGNNYFYTGLLNGKLTEWKIVYSNNNIKNKIKKNLNYQIKETKHIYTHNSSITAIEIYNKQNIIITAGEDKFINIRKVYDFELLTVIDLTYSFGNEIISKTNNIFPSSIKISDLNLIYVLLYDYDSNQFFLRGYNLNGQSCHYGCLPRRSRPPHRRRTDPGRLRRAGCNPPRTRHRGPHQRHHPRPLRQRPHRLPAGPRRRAHHL